MPAASGSRITFSSNSIDHMANIAHRSSFKREFSDIYYCFITNIDCKQTCFFNPYFATTVTCTHNARSPCVLFSLAEECINCIWPQTKFSKRVATCKHHSILNSVSNSRFLVCTPNNILISSSGEIAKGILLCIVRNQFLHKLSVRIFHNLNWLNPSKIQSKGNNHNKEPKNRKCC